MSKNNGAPAFPTTRDSNYEVCSKGITARDYFAAKAMQGYIAYMGCEAEATGFMGGQNSKVLALLALNAYKFADAMIVEREK